MGGDAQLQLLLMEGSLQLADNIALWPHLERVIMRDSAFIHLEAIMMFRYRYDIFGARSFE
ncbi:hypothetical protein D3C81_2286560 [compost metagenome]